MIGRRNGLSGILIRCAGAALLALAGHVARAADVGETVMVRNDVTGTPTGGAMRKMVVGDGIGLGLALATAQASAVKMTFVPHGSLTLGPETRLAIEQTVVDRATGRDTSKLSLSVGRLRVALGKLFEGDVEVKTPAAVIGIKGTDVLLDLDAAGRLTVLVLAGTAKVGEAGGGGTVDLSPGHYTTVEPGGAPGASRPLDATVRSFVDEALADFGLSPTPPPPRIDQDLVSASFGGGGGAGKGAGGGRGLSIETATASPAAGGMAFSDPSLAGFPVSPFLGLQRGGQPPIVGGP
ncbi:MAG TPA: FecR family protein [Candidatus Cryosericum sp.]|nr:FecR family protein [Candidatus Cryosericum sp.]